LVVLEGEKNIDQERWRFLSWLAGHCNEAIRAAYWQTGQLLGVGYWGGARTMEIGPIRNQNLIF